MLLPQPNMQVEVHNVNQEGMKIKQIMGHSLEEKLMSKTRHYSF